MRCNKIFFIILVPDFSRSHLSKGLKDVFGSDARIILEKTFWRFRLQGKFVNCVLATLVKAKLEIGIRAFSSLIKNVGNKKAKLTNFFAGSANTSKQRIIFLLLLCHLKKTATFLHFKGRTFSQKASIFIVWIHAMNRSWHSWRSGIASEPI